MVDTQSPDEGIQNSKIVANPTPVASLTLQVCIHVDYYVQWAYFIITSFLMFWKIYRYSYPIEIFAFEILLFVILMLIQTTRIFLGSRGNKTESSTVTFFFIMLTLLAALGNLYFLQVQTYIIVGEVLIGSIVLVFALLEFLFGIIAAIEFKSLENSQ